jgi:hypothetical protein
MTYPNILIQKLFFMYQISIDPPVSIQCGASKLLQIISTSSGVS